MMNPRIRLTILLAVVTLILGVLGVKALRQGWFMVPSLPELGGQPALLFFTLADGCDCQMTVIRAAEVQLADWASPLPLYHIDFDSRYDLVAKFHVARAPALVLVNAEGQVVWKQEEGLNDESPLDLDQADRQIEALIELENP